MYLKFARKEAIHPQKFQRLLRWTKTVQEKVKFEEKSAKIYRAVPNEHHLQIIGELAGPFLHQHCMCYLSIIKNMFLNEELSLILQKS